MKTKRKLLILSPALVVSYITLEHLQKYFQIVSPVIDIYAARNHQYFLIFQITTYLTLLLQLIYLFFAAKNFNNQENLIVIIVLNFIISVVTVNMSIATFNLLLFSTL